MSLHNVNTSNLCRTNSRMSALPSTTIDLFFNWYLVLLSFTNVWPLLFSKVILYPNSIKLVRCSLLKRLVLLRRRHKVHHLPWLLVIRMTLMKFLIISLPTSIIMEGKSQQQWWSCGWKGVPTEGIMRLVVV